MKNVPKPGLCLSRCLRLAAVLGMLTVLSACTSAEDLYPEARCGDKALTDTKKDAPKIIALASEDISEVSGRFYENVNLTYTAECYISDEDGNFLFGDAAYFIGIENSPGREPKRFFRKKDFSGLPKNVTSKLEKVEGVSGRGSAAVWAPCSMKKSTGFRPGTMVATISAPSAPDGDSVEQRQNAADLALSLLRHAVEKCDEPPTLPKTVKVAG
jgi:hypothetical protein